MDDETLAKQYSQTGNLMDLCNDQAWVEELARAEDAVEGVVEAGAVMRDYAQAVQSLTPTQVQQVRQNMRVQSILFIGLRQWMQSWDLGAGFEDTYTLARRLVRSHLADLNPDIQPVLDRLLAEDTGSINTSIQQQQAITLLSGMFTQDDWQALAYTASQSISSRVLRAGQEQAMTEVA